MGGIKPERADRKNVGRFQEKWTDEERITAGGRVPKTIRERVIERMKAYLVAFHGGARVEAVKLRFHKRHVGAAGDEPRFDTRRI